jgi:HAD superfamily hydrolase (TIGR01662 family)
MAGGKGTRLSLVTNDIIPKSMVMINGIPLLEHQINILSRYDIKEIIIVIGFLHNQIESYFGNGANWGISIKYIIENVPRGTGGSLIFLKELVKEDFLLLFGDLIFDFSIPRMKNIHQVNNSLITLFAHPNSHPYDSDLLVLNNENKVTGYCSKHTTRHGYFRNLVNAGIYIINPDLFMLLPLTEIIDLEKDVIFPLCDNNNAIFAYVSSEYVKDAGTPERLQAIEHDMKKGIISSKNLDNPQKCIFLNSDDILNYYNGLVYNFDKSDLEKKLVDIVRTINNSQYLAIIINQSVIDRSLYSRNDIDFIPNKIETLLGEQGAYLDTILYYSQSPDKDFKDQNMLCCSFNIEIIEECINRFNISLQDSFFIGHSDADIQIGKYIGMKTVFVKTDKTNFDVKYLDNVDHICSDVFDAVRTILNLER